MVRLAGDSVGCHLDRVEIGPEPASGIEAATTHKSAVGWSMLIQRLATVRAAARPSRWATFTRDAVLLGFCLAPALFVDVPPLVDYPNHLARMFLLSVEGGRNAFYHAHWAVYPNLAMDLIVPALAKLIPVLDAARLFYLLSELLVVSGSIVLERVIKGRVQLTPLAAALFLYTPPFAWGFVNFEFGFGLALWAMAAWFVTGPQWAWRRSFVHALACAALFTAHLFALGLYGVVLGLHELWRLRAERANLRAALVAAAWLGWPVVILLALIGVSGGGVGGSGNDWAFSAKLGWLFHLMSGHHLWLSTVEMSILLMGLVSAARSGCLRFVQSGAYLLAGFLVLYVAMPFRLFDTAFVDIRVLAAAAFVLPAFVAIPAEVRQWRTWARIGAALAVLNCGFVWRDFLEYRRDYREVIASFEGLNPGSKVLVAHSGFAADPPSDLLEYPMYHAPTLAVAYAGAFVPTLFTYPGKQPLEVSPSVQRLDVPQGGPAPIDLLDAIAAGQVPHPPEFIRSWWTDFDYVYVLGPARVWRPRVAPDEVTRGRRFVLYRLHGGAPPVRVTRAPP